MDKVQQVQLIRTEADYVAALDRIDALMDAEFGSPEGRELDVLVGVVERYERNMHQLVRNRSVR